jgi:hypothetical protein
MLEMLNAPIARSFLIDGESENEDEIRPSPIILPLYFHPLAPGQEQQRILLISSPNWVRETIHDLHARNFANTKDWSSLVPGANPGEVVSILTRRRQRP